MVGDISTDTLESVEQFPTANLHTEPPEVYETDKPSTYLRTYITAGITAQLDSVSVKRCTRPTRFDMYKHLSHGLSKEIDQCVEMA